METIAEALGRLRDAGEQLSEVPCPRLVPMRRGGPYSHVDVAAELCPDCNGSSTVPSDLAKAVEMATTVPGDAPSDSPVVWTTPVEYRARHDGRVLRPAPGEVPCPEIAIDPLNYQAFGTGCPTCGGSGTVPGTDEASVVARWQFIGLLQPVLLALADVGSEESPLHVVKNKRAYLKSYLALGMAIGSGDVPSTLEAAAEAVEAVAKVKESM